MKRLILVGALMQGGCAFFTGADSDGLNDLQLCAAFGSSNRVSAREQAATRYRAEMVKRRLLSDREWQAVEARRIYVGMSECGLYANGALTQTLNAVCNVAMETSTPEAALDRAATFLGSWSALARALNLSPMAVSHWRRRGVPIHRARDIEVATGGVVKRHELRPDIFDPPAQDAA